MRYLIKNSLILFVLIFTFCTNSAGDRNSLKTEKNEPQLKNVYSLAKRVLEGRSVKFVFELKQKDTGKDFFEISRSGAKVLITGNNGVSLASGLNWYLKKYCNS
jgi:alpha-N-acetylglucosaminidase